MSWWGIGNDDVIGDSPANALTEALVAIGTEHQEKGQLEPGLPEALDGFAKALWQHKARLLQDGSTYPARRLVARLGSGVEVTSGGIDGQAEQVMVSVFVDALIVIARQYQERWERKPRLKEVLETLTFILRARPDRFLSGMEGQSVDEITAK